MLAASEITDENAALEVGLDLFDLRQIPQYFKDLTLPLLIGGLVTGDLTSAFITGTGWRNLSGDRLCHAQELPTIIDVELRQHNPAVLNVSVAQAICQMPSRADHV